MIQANQQLTLQLEFTSGAVKITLHSTFLDTTLLTEHFFSILSSFMATLKAHFPSTINIFSDQGLAIYSFTLTEDLSYPATYDLIKTIQEKIIAAQPTYVSNNSVKNINGITFEIPCERKIKLKIMKYLYLDLKGDKDRYSPNFIILPHYNKTKLQNKIIIGQFIHEELPIEPEDLNLLYSQLENILKKNHHTQESLENLMKNIKGKKKLKEITPICHTFLEILQKFKQTFITLKLPPKTITNWYYILYNSMSDL